MLTFPASSDSVHLLHMLLDPGQETQTAVISCSHELQIDPDDACPKSEMSEMPLSHGDPTDKRESTSVFQIRTINQSKLDKRQVSMIDSRRK